MAKKEFKYIKGQCYPGQPADICFYTDVDSWSVSDFLWEFQYLVNYCEPSKIRVHINSVGGSVVEGMSVFSKLMDSTIPIETINDSLAASIGSVIWAAGGELFMKDYALLMIHNPFMEGVSSESPEVKQVISAFTNQLKTLYMKRFGLTEEEVTALMDGKEGEDGTFMTAQEAVAKGFLKADHIIETPAIVKDKVNAVLAGKKGLKEIQAAIRDVEDIIKDATDTKSNKKPLQKTMEENNEITVVAAILGLTGSKATQANVTAQINELKAKAEKVEGLQKALDEANAKLTKTEAELTGANTSVKNLTEDLDKTKAALKSYQDAEAKAKEERVNALVESAIASCKINKDERDIYTRMAMNDYELAENVLAKIPGRADLKEETSKANVEQAKDGMKTEEEKLMAKVDEIVGQDFKFRSFGK